MLGSAYGQGTIDVWNTEKGGLKLIKTIISDGKLGPNEESRESPHPHQAVLDPSGRFFAVNDLGTDTILLIDTEDDAYEVVNNFRVTPAGCGPRHGVFWPSYNPEASYYILVCELTNTINVYSLEYTDNIVVPTLEQSLSTLGNDTDDPSQSTASAGEIISIAESDVYVSNRNTGEQTDNIAHFRIIQDDDDRLKITLEYEGKTSTSGTSPRMFSATNDFGTAFVGNQGGPLGVVALVR